MQTWRQVHIKICLLFTWKQFSEIAVVTPTKLKNMMIIFLLNFHVYHLSLIPCHGFFRNKVAMSSCMEETIRSGVLSISSNEEMTFYVIQTVLFSIKFTLIWIDHKTNFCWFSKNNLNSMSTLQPLSVFAFISSLTFSLLIPRAMLLKLRVYNVFHFCSSGEAPDPGFSQRQKEDKK